jgi:hypothetical protein
VRPSFAGLVDSVSARSETLSRALASISVSRFDFHFHAESFGLRAAEFGPLGRIGLRLVLPSRARRSRKQITDPFSVLSASSILCATRDFPLQLCV